jgi:uncharacterized membrane protein
MNPVVIVHLIAGLFSIGMSVPLATGKVRRNLWYGVRLPEAFESEERWAEINRHGGRLFLAWSLVIVATATAGAFVPRSGWVIYDFGSLAVIVGGLIVVVARICRHVRAPRPGP